MRLWHKDLIHVLPRQQLLGQWRELCLIAKEIDRKGTPGHVLVNRVTEYPVEHLAMYADLVACEMGYRGYKVNFSKLDKYLPELDIRRYPKGRSSLFAGWHNDRYLKQCYYNLQEKTDAGAISREEFWPILCLAVERRIVP